MRKIYTIVLFLSLWIANASGQNQLDLYGYPISNSKTLKGSTTNQTISLSSSSYDSIRPLSELNTPSLGESYPWISPDGLRLYYTKELSGGPMLNQLWFTQRVDTNSLFSAPVNVPLPVTSAFSCWFSSDELDAYICTHDTLFYTYRSTIGSLFNTLTYINLNIPFSYNSIKSASLNSSQNILYLYIFNLSSVKLIELTRTSPTSFSYSRTINAPPGFTTNPGQLSKDELTFYTGSYPSSPNELIHQFSRTLTTDTFALSSFQQVPDINDTGISNSQASMSDGLRWVAFVRNSTGWWEGNDLYLAHRGADINTAIKKNESNLTVKIYPNPSTGIFTFTQREPKMCELEIHNILGDLIYKTNTTNQHLTLDLSKEAKGIYFVRLTDNSKNVIYEKIIIQ